MYLFSAATILDESTDTSIIDSSPKLSPIEAPVFKRLTRQASALAHVEHSQKSVCDLVSSQSICDDSVSNASTPNDIGKSMSTLNIEYDRDDLKEQLLQRCGQTDILTFDEIYSARYCHIQRTAYCVVHLIDKFCFVLQSPAKV